MCRSLNPQHQKRQKDSRSPRPVGIYVALGRAKRLGLRLSFCRFCLEGFQRLTVLITAFVKPWTRNSDFGLRISFGFRISFHTDGILLVRRCTRRASRFRNSLSSRCVSPRNNSSADQPLL